MSFWLIKTDPTVYSWDRLMEEKETSWNGIRNYEARKYLREMKVGDRVVIYHGGDDREVRGIAEITKEAYDDPTATSGGWVSVGIRAVVPVGRPLGLEEIRNTHGLAVMPLVTRPRLSVHPISGQQWEYLLKYTRTSDVGKYIKESEAGSKKLASALRS